jgi:hypothetical protein
MKTYYNSVKKGIKYIISFGLVRLIIEKGYEYYMGYSYTY